MTIKTTSHKKDILLVLIILAAAAIGFLWNHQMHKKPAAQLQIQIDGQTIAAYDLTKDTDVVINGANGGTNHLIIEDGTARISEASCPDKVCINQGRIEMNGQIIVCLPNRMTATIIAPEY